MITEVIKKRRAVFPDQYNGKPIAKESILEILEAGNWAPTHKKTEPWRFKVMQDVALEELGEFMAQKFKESTPKYSEFKYKKLRNNPKKAACIIAICMQRDPKKRLPEWEEIAATAMAVQNMWLTATELGIGSYWSSPKLIAQLSEFLKLKESECCLGLFYLGNFDGELPQGKRTPIEDKVTWM